MNDLIYNTLGLNGYTGSVNGRLLSYFKGLSSNATTLQGCEAEFLARLGYTSGSNQDRWNAYLSQLGFTGSLADKLRKYWSGAYSTSAVLNMRQGVLDSRVTFTRTTVGNDYNPSGNLESNVINTPRFNYNPSTLSALGLLIEPQRTNYIRNPRQEGAVVGTIGSGGSLATYQAAVGTSAGISVALVGTGIENGFSYQDIRFFGTATSTTQTQIQFDGSANMSAVASEYFIGSVYVRKVAGTNTGVNSLLHDVIARNSGGTNLGSNVDTILGNIAVAKLTDYRSQVGYTMPATTAFVQHDIRIDYTSGAVIDITLRVAAPQCEKALAGDSASMPIFPAVGTPAVSTRTLDNAVISDLSTIGFNSLRGMVYAEAYCPTLGTGIYPAILTFDDGTANNSISIVVLDATTDKVTLDRVIAGVPQTSPVSVSTATSGQLLKIAAYWEANKFRLAVNGVGATEVTSGAVPTGLTRALIGLNRGGGNPWNSNIAYIETNFIREWTTADLVARTS